MAKRFLDTLDDAFEDDMLQDVIPMRKGSVTRRKKSFLNSIQEKKRPTNNAPAKNTSSNGKKKRKSFLESIEDALENNAFDDVIPDNPSWKKHKKSTSPKELKKLETRLSTSIPTNVLDRAKDIAKLKELHLKEVINIALKWYVENDGKI